MAGFTHLHVHSEYSLLDGLARVPDLVKVAKAQGFDTLALTDHGVMHGAVQFYQKCKDAGIKPILGCEVYVARRGRQDREHDKDAKPYHLTVLAENETGYRNLMRLVSMAQLEGFYYKPRIDREILAAHSEGLIVLSGCPSAEVPRQLLDGQTDAAREALGWYREVFGDRYYVELQNHQIDFLPALNKQLVALAREFELPLVATNDVHYARAEDANAHEVLLCIQTGSTMTDPKRMRLDAQSFYLRSEAEMRALFPELPEAIDNTARIAERCDVQLEFGKYKLPVFAVPDGESAATYLHRLCEAGLAGRYEQVTAEIRERLAYELSVIGRMGFDDYFLIVWDLCRHARERGIWWNVRGSGAGSIVAYTLGITNIDPLKHHLIFERFLNPSRVSMPDIDLDFPDDQRDEMIQYTFRTYGRDRVAQIITFGTMGARAAIRDAGRALDYALSEVDSVARLVPAIPGKPCGIADAMRPVNDDGEVNEFYTPDLAQRYDGDELIRKLLDTAKTLEGVARHASTHAAGVVISDRPLTEYIPLHRATSSSASGESPSLTQFAMNDVEKLGLLKVDFLGLSTLTVLRRAAELVEHYHGVKFTLDNFPLDDPAIYELLSTGNVTGVFQVEGAGMRKMLGEMQPRKFEHVVAAIALYRPGPMDYIPEYIARMHGRQPVQYHHPRLEPILAETYGIIVYQEQIIQIARDLAGYDAGEADTIRKAVGKKNKDDLLKHRAQFLAGAAANGIAAAQAEAIFADIELFARYGFNKAHAADYAVIVCQTAYLKAIYPVEYAAALLSSDRDNTEKIALVAADCHRMGIKLLPPDISASELDFSIESLSAEAFAEAGVVRRRGIRFGLVAVKNVGEGPARAILTTRADGPFKSLGDLCRRLDLRSVGKRALESLVKAGALDAFGPRSSLLHVLDRMMSYSSSHHQAEALGQMSLFGAALPPEEQETFEPLPIVSSDHKTELAWEKELIGLYLSEHPLQRVAESMAQTATAMIGAIDEELVGQPVTLAGMVVAVRRVTTKKGDTMAFARLEDLQGGIEVILFPKVFQATRDVWVDDNLVLVRGTVESRNDRLQVVAEAAEAYVAETVAERVAAEEAEPEVIAEGGATYQLFVTIPRSQDMDDDIRTLGRVYEALTGFRGHDRFRLIVSHGPNEVELDFPNHTTRYCVSLVRALEVLLGEGCVEVTVA
jgi:DNA polymerase-3 subunit alpha